jgi:GINS complex subunit 3
MSYLDIDQILCEEERIPATFLLDAPGLGHLDTSIDSEDLPENSRIELPLWLALAFGRKNMVNLELPKHFERKMRDEILAGAENINLKEFSHYFFEVGSSLAIETRNEDLKTTLQIAFAGERFRSLMMHALSR